MQQERKMKLMNILVDNQICGTKEMLEDMYTLKN